MKVGVFLGDYSPDIGGAYTFQQEICRVIKSKGPASGHQFVFFTPSQLEAADATAGAGFKVIRIRRNVQRNQLFNWCRSGFDFFARAVLRRVSAKFLDRMVDPISMHIREEAIDVTWSLTPACFSTEVPFITTLWDLEHRNQPYFPEVSIQNEWESRETHYCALLRKAAYVITGTKVGLMDIERFYHLPSGRIKVLPMPTPHFAAQENPEDDDSLLHYYGIPDRYLFYPAQFWPHKNHYGVLTSLLALRERYGLHLPVVFVGSDKGNLSYIKKLVIELGLTEQVHFLGFVPRDHLSTLYRRAFALLYLSYFGPDNVPPLEAFALGCPVIASNVSGAKEQLGDAAMLVDPNSPSDIATAINLLVMDRELRLTLANRGRARASTCTGENYFQGVCSIFDEFENVRRTWSSSEPFELAR